LKVPALWVKTHRTQATRQQTPRAALLEKASGRGSQIYRSEPQPFGGREVENGGSVRTSVSIGLNTRIGKDSGVGSAPRPGHRANQSIIESEKTDPAVFKFHNLLVYPGQIMKWPSSRQDERTWGYSGVEGADVPVGMVPCTGIIYERGKKKCW